MPPQKSGKLPPALAAEIRRLLTQILIEDMRLNATAAENPPVWNDYDDGVLGQVDHPHAVRTSTEV
jgi:hypothetical protein